MAFRKYKSNNKRYGTYMNYEQYDELLRQKKDIESIIKEIQTNYYHELNKLIDINKQIKEMESGND